MSGKSPDYVRGQVSILSFVLGWLASLEGIERERDKAPLSGPVPPSRYSGIQEIKDLADAISIHIGPEG